MAIQVINAFHSLKCMHNANSKLEHLIQPYLSYLLPTQLVLQFANTCNKMVLTLARISLCPLLTPWNAFSATVYLLLSPLLLFRMLCLN